MKNNVLVFIFLASTAGVFSQNASLSPYSYFGFGQSVSNRTAENNAMGGVTVYADSTQFSLDNPATLGKLDFVQYRFGASYKTASQQSMSATEYTNNARLNYLALSIPTKHFAFGFGIKPKTGMGYRLNVVETINEIENSILHQGSGGLNSTFLSLAYNPFQGLSIGASAHYNFGFTERIFTRSVSGIELSTQVFTRSELSGIQFLLGAHYQTEIREDYQLYLSATFTPSSKLNGTNTRFISTISSIGNTATRDVLDLADLAQTTNTLPSQTSLGIGFGKQQKWFVGASYNIAKEGLTYPLEMNTAVSYSSSSRISLGGFYIPQYSSFTNYFKRIVYRTGIRFENMGMNIKNQAIKDFGITFGLGLPIGNFSKANIGVEVGKMGTKNAGLIEEKYTNIMLGFSLSDIWFIKRKYD